MDPNPLLSCITSEMFYIQWRGTDTPTPPDYLECSVRGPWIPPSVLKSSLIPIMNTTSVVKLRPLGLYPNPHVPASHSTCPGRGDRKKTPGEAPGMAHKKVEGSLECSPARQEQGHNLDFFCLPRHRGMGVIVFRLTFLGNSSNKIRDVMICACWC